MLRRLFLSIFFSFTLTGCFAQNAKIENKSAASDPYVWDFGQAKEGTVLKHDFILHNRSSRALKVKDITTSCGCAASRAKKNLIPPGESTPISVTFNTRGYSGATEQFIYVHTDSLDNPILKFIIKADIVKK